MWNHNTNNNNRNNSHLDAKKYDEEIALAKALSLSAESFAKEEKKRQEFEEAEMQKQISILKQKENVEKLEKQKQMQDPRYLKCSSIQSFLNVMNWSQMYSNRSVGCGLQNLGNSCFMNATLQCIAYTAPFAQLLNVASHSRSCSKQGFCSLCECERLIPSMLLSGSRVQKPMNLFRNLARINDLLTPGCQEDAHEFLQSLLDKLEMAYDDTYYEINNKSKNHKKDPFNPIRNLFVGTTKTAVMCAKCRNVTTTEEPFSCVSLDVDPDSTLCESLGIFTHDELLRGIEKYFCDKCNRKVIAHKKLTLAKLPPILIFHFKRFRLESYSPHQKEFSMKKISDYVEYPQIFNFKEYLDLVIHPTHQNQVSKDSEYELYGIVVHSGPKLGYGHYYAYIQSLNGQWFRMNDMEVLPVKLEKALKEQAYLLFYRRKTHKIMENEINRIKVEMMRQLNKLNSNINSSNLNKIFPINNNNNKNKINNNINIKPMNSLQTNNENKNQNDNPNKSLSDAKVDVDLANDNYFVSSCSNDPNDVIVMNDSRESSVTTNNNLIKNQQFISKKSKSSSSETRENRSDSDQNDRAEYVNIPPLATRPEISAFDSESNDDEDCNGNNNDNDSNKHIRDNVRRAQRAKDGFEEVIGVGMGMND